MTLLRDRDQKAGQIASTVSFRFRYRKVNQNSKFVLDSSRCPIVQGIDCQPHSLSNSSQLSSFTDSSFDANANAMANITSLSEFTHHEEDFTGNL